jgi:hypothetical protein
MTRYKILLQSVTPISHGDTVTGVDNATNTRIFMRQGMLIDGVPARVPAISENALRAVIFRQTLHDDLLARLGVGPGQLPQSVVNLLYSGGSVAAGAKAPTDEVELGHKIKTLYPTIDLLGGAVDAFILPRARLRIAAWLVAREYVPFLRLVAPDLVDEAEQVSAYDLITDETRTRGTGGESNGNQMIYTYETLAAGAKLLVEVTLDARTPPAAAAATGLAIASWDGYFGGQSRQGRGRIAVLLHGAPDIGPYLEHIELHKEAMLTGLMDGSLGTGKRLCA